MKKKTVRIEALATAAEAKAIKAAAKSERLSLSAYIISAALRRAESQREAS